MIIKKLLKKYTILLLIFCGCTSCGIYRQNVVNVPLMQHSGQVQGGVHVGFTGHDGQIGCSLTDHVALMANYNDMGTRKVTYSLTNYEINKHHFGEIGAGYFTKNTNGLIYEFFLLAGKGWSYHYVTGGDTMQGHTPPFTNVRDIDYNRYLIQADFGKAMRKLEFAFSPRIFLIHYYNILDSGNDTYLNLTHSYVFSDMALTLRYNIFKCLKISGQASFTIPVTGFNAAYYESSPFNVSIGLILNMNFIKNKHGQ